MQRLQKEQGLKFWFDFVFNFIFLVYSVQAVWLHKIKFW